MADTSPESEEQQRRRLDRVTGRRYLEGLSDRTVVEVRTMREECREEEARLSFVRRLVQGRLDIVRAEGARRAGGSSGDLLDALPAILADAPLPTTMGMARAAPLYEPDLGDSAGRRRDDEVMNDASLGRLPDASDSELATLTQRLMDDEQRVSGVRRRLLDNLDGLQAEMIRRYQSGGVALDDVVSYAVGSAETRAAH